MFTSRAEYRVLLRQDNADIRLTELGHKLGLATDERLDRVLDKKNGVNHLIAFLEKVKVDPIHVNDELTQMNTAVIREKIAIASLLKRPEISIREIKSLNRDLAQTINQFSEEIQQQAEIEIKYQTYIERERKLAEKIGSLENYKIKADFDYDRVKALSAEAREKLKKIKPETIGQASRISGVSPADISILTVYMGK
jgi:tRNA uridine 5-carboxymethylaminomethyl modification enzyme